MIREALGYPWRGRAETVTTMVLGGMLTFFGFLVVPQVLLLGYVMRVLRGTARGEETPPVFERWADLLVLGSKGYVVWLGWTAVPLLVRFGLNGGHLEPGQATVWLLGWMVSANVLSLLQDSATASGLLDGFGFSEPYVDLLIVLYVLPAALANVAETGTIRAGFFEGGLRRYLSWVFGLLESVVPVVGRLAQRVLDAVLPESASSFGPVATLTDPRYALAWGGYALLWVAGEAVLRLFVYLPTSSGVATWLSMGYLVCALVAFFSLRVAAWSVIGRAWPAVRPVATGETPSAGTDARAVGSGDRGEQGAAGTSPAGPVETGDPHYRSRPLSTLGVELPAARTTLAGGLLSTFGLVVLPGVFVAGYLVQVLRATSRDEGVPLLGGFRRLLGDGLRAYVVWAGYSVLPAGLLFVALTDTAGAGPGSESVLTDLVVWGALSGVGLPGGWPAVVLGLGVGAGGLLVALAVSVTVLPPALLPLAGAVLSTPLPVALAVFVLSAYVVPAALLAFARSGSLRAAFSPRLASTLLRGDYAVRWVVAVTLSSVGWVALLVVSVAVVHPFLAGTPLVEPIAGLELVTFFSGPTSVAALTFWLSLVLAGTVHFASLVAAAAVVGRVAARPDGETAGDLRPSTGLSR